MNTNKKILFFDIDGTLLTPPPFTVPDSTKDALKKAQAAGHLTFINTGRTLAIIPDNIKELGFDGYVCGCGSQIYMHDKLLFTNSMPNELCREIIEVLRKCKIPAFFEQPECILFDGMAPIQSGIVELFKGKFPMEDLSQFDSETARTYTFAKFLISARPESALDTFTEFCKAKNLVYFDHGSGHWEVTPKNCSKATGIQFLLDTLDIPLENSYAFGDSNNDLPMLKYAGTSIAMGNAMKEILPFCTYQTTDICEDGIYNAMAHLGLLG